MTTASLGDISRALSVWIGNRVRIDEWTLNPPSTVGVRIPDPENPGQFIDQPSNTGVVLPVSEVEFMKVSPEIVEATATFSFFIQYRYTKLLEYHQVPRDSGEDLLNDLLLRALVRPTEIHPSIIEISIPEQDSIGIHEEFKHADGDYILGLRPTFKIHFRANFSPQETEEDSPVINEFRLGIHRGDILFDVENPETFNLDRNISIEIPPPA